MLDLFLEGMGGDLEVHKFYPHKMKIGPCTSCWACWGNKNPGVCVQKDDFEKILEVFKRADYFVIAAPLYVFDFPATVKNVIDRFFVTLDPAQVPNARGETEHPKRFSRNLKAVLISSCGFPEASNFDILRRHFHVMCEHMNWNYSGEILLPAAGAANVPRLFAGKYALIKKAGAELVQNAVNAETMKGIEAPVISADNYRKMTTLSFKPGIAAKAEMVFAVLRALLRKPKTEIQNPPNDAVV